MKLLMLDDCCEINDGASLTVGKIYNIEYSGVHEVDERGTCTTIAYINATTEQRKNMKKGFAIINDDGEEEYIRDEFYHMYYKFFETDNELAHYLIDNVEGLEDSIVNLAMRF